jgi:CRP-like cAMP-binding protein
MRWHRQIRTESRNALHLAGLDRRLTARARRELGAHADVLELVPGELLVRAGETARELVVVVDGIVEIVDGDGGGHLAGAGTRIGERELATGGRHPVTVRAHSACTVVVVFGPAYRLWACPRGHRPAPVRAAFTT